MKPTDAALSGQWRELFTALLADTASITDRPEGLATLAFGLLWSRCAQSVALYRLGHLVAGIGLWPLAELLQRTAVILYGIDISYKAVIGPGFAIHHGNGLVIGDSVRIGRNVLVFHGVTLGYRWSTGTLPPWRAIPSSEQGADGMPTIEDGVMIGAGAAVLGPVMVGAGSRIGANAVVTKNVPPGSLVTGPPSIYRS